MSQEEVLNILEKAIKPMSRGQIANALCQDAIRVSHALTRLLKAREIKCMEISCEEAMRFYNCHRRMKIYFV